MSYIQLSDFWSTNEEEDLLKVRDCKGSRFLSRRFTNEQGLAEGIEGLNLNLNFKLYLFNQKNLQ